MPKITFVGLGIREFDQLTLEGLHVLQRAERIFYLATRSDRVEDRLNRLGFNLIENLGRLYKNGALDTDNYKAILRRIVQATKVYSNICVLLPGHPRVGVTLVYWLEELKDTLGLEITVLEGISSFCSMINELRIDPLEHGAALMDANRVLQQDQPLNPTIDCFIYHVCSVGVQATHLSDPSRENRLDLLQIKLQKHYHNEHPVTLISSSRGSEESTLKKMGTVGTLTDLLPHVHFGTTLYIPAYSRKGAHHEHNNHSNS